MARIVIVDDSVVVRSRLRNILTAEGHEIVGEAANGKEGIALSKDKKPDIVTMDLTMPEMDGITACKHLSQDETLKGTKIIMISSIGKEEEILKAIRNGASYYVIKPFSAEQVLKIVNIILHKDDMTEKKEDEAALIEVIDDSPTVLATVSAFLKDDGHSIITSRSPLKGIELAETGNPDLLILDLTMPEIDGFDVLRVLQKGEVTQRIPVMMLTGRSNKEDIINAMTFGVVDYMVKPFKENDLRKRVKTALKFSRILKSKSINDSTLPIVLQRKGGLTIISLREIINSPGPGDAVAKTFSNSFLSMIQKDSIVLDLRNIKQLTSKILKVMDELFIVLKEIDVSIITGRHYGQIVSDTDLDDAYKLFVSFGDFEEQLEVKKI